ncbi:MAG: hypothetical protein OHK0041_19900 [Anaerolineales bacterium]
MPTKEKQNEQTTKWYDITYPASAYTFPREALIHRVRFDNEYIHVELTDGRLLSIPLWWIPTLHNALPEEREKYEISQDRKMIIWDPDKCAINDEVRIDDYLAPRATDKPQADE